MRLSQTSSPMWWLLCRLVASQPKPCPIAGAHTSALSFGRRRRLSRSTILECSNWRKRAGACSSYSCGVSCQRLVAHVLSSRSCRCRTSATRCPTTTFASATSARPQSRPSTRLRELTLRCRTLPTCPPAAHLSRARDLISRPAPGGACFILAARAGLQCWRRAISFRVASRVEVYWKGPLLPGAHPRETGRRKSGDECEAGHGG